MRSLGFPSAIFGAASDSLSDVLEFRRFGVVFEAFFEVHSASHVRQYRVKLNAFPCPTIRKTFQQTSTGTKEVGFGVFEVVGRWMASAFAAMTLFARPQQTVIIDAEVIFNRRALPCAKEGGESAAAFDCDVFLSWFW
jgi:hypothetical protein